MSWQAEYLAALEARDRREKANDELIQASSGEDTKLADRTASLAVAPRPPQAPPETPRSPRAGFPTPGQRTKDKPTSSPTPTLTEPLFADLKRDLAEAQRTRADLQARLKAKTDQLELLTKKHQSTSKQAQELSTDRTALTTRLRDKEDELRGKTKLLEDLQDEVMSLNIQLNVAELRAQELTKDNQRLIDRWMARMGKEADAMNEASKFA
ncbi:MAG: hypothetical protein M1815_004282 [Lichina confinis]|nr:MAG: hypothetical protein M1815_004282 [Lichina confinis]